MNIIVPEGIKNQAMSLCLAEWSEKTSSLNGAYFWF